MVIGGLKELYPFESRFLDLDGRRYHYLDEGQGEALFMLHGNPTWSFYFRNLIITLRNSFRCIAPDHMGCGLSDKPQDYPYTLSTHIENTQSLTSHLNLESVTLLLHDWGGAIGMGWAVRHPKKVKRLIILNTAAFLDNHIPFSINICRLPLIGPVAIRGFNAFALGALKRAVKHKERLTPEVRAGFLAPYDSWANRIALLRFVQDIPMSPDIDSYPVVKSIESQLKNFCDIPALILWGRRDFCFNRHFFQRWKDILPRAEIHEFDDAGHYVVEDAYERMIPLIIEFMSRNS